MRDAFSEAICSRCLGTVDVDVEELAVACRDRTASTIYASDELAFPGIGVPKLKATCARCGTKTVAIAVENDVAAKVAR